MYCHKTLERIQIERILADLKEIENNFEEKEILYLGEVGGKEGKVERGEEGDWGEEVVHIFGYK